MRWIVVGLGMSIALWLSAQVSAQQVLQLPSFSSFGVDTTVVVPDSGAARTGDVRRGSSSTSSFGGIPRQRSLGLNRQAAGTFVRAQVHDLQVADQALLDKAQSRRGAKMADKAAAPHGPATDPLPGSVAEMQRRRTDQSATAEREALALFDKGRQAQAAGKASVAVVYFRMAARGASGPLRQKIDAALHAARAGAMKVPDKNAAAEAANPAR